MTLRHSFALYQLQNECNDVVLKEYLGHSDIRQTLNYKKLLRQTFFTPLDFTGKTVPVKQIKELVYMQRYPSEEGLCKFIEEAKECKDSKIKIAENHSQWLQWLSKAKEKNLDCSESSSENFTGCKDYIFLDLRKLSEHRPRKKIRIIQALLAVSKKKLLICPEE